MNGLHELPLIIFTVLAQSVVGAFLIFVFAAVKTENEKSFQYIHKMMLTLLVLLAIGFFCSILHLGSPLRAFNSLNRIGSSMLSNEIATGALFFVAMGLYWLLVILEKMPLALEKIWLIVTALIGLVFMYMMANVYRISSVPTWNTALTPLNFYLTVIVGGIALAKMLFSPNPNKEYSLAWTNWVYGIGLIMIAVTIIYQAVQLATIHTSMQQAIDLVPNFASIMALRLCCLAITLLLLIRSTSLIPLITSCLLTFVGEMLGRTLFYGSHMTLGMAVGG